MKRIYENVIEDQIKNYDQMILLAGPRQVGKTTISKNIMKNFFSYKYLNWDNIDDRHLILGGNQVILKNLPLDIVSEEKPIIIFDEIHKYSRWKEFLKGYIDECKGQINTIVTGSSKLDVYSRGGDSLMGRYFLYKIAPISVAEMIDSKIIDQPISKPRKLENDLFNILFEFGGFPEPLLKQNKLFFNRWQKLRLQQTFKEDIRDLAKIQELAQLEVLAKILKYQTGQLVNYSNLANKVRVSDQTIRRWINILESFHYSYMIRPWSNNISRSLLKEPKLYLWDWSMIEDRGAKVENFVASHLKKTVDFWSDYGFGDYDLYFVRDKDKREVDFLITQNNQPWILIEVKTSSNESLSKNLFHFQSMTNVPYAFQLAFDLPYIEFDFRNITTPKILPIKSFLSQLV